jgi:peptide-methionine (S)-S-oxide reductase
MKTIIKKAEILLFLRIGVQFFLLLFLANHLLFPEHINAQSMNSKQSVSVHETATFGAGCFWCVEAIYSRVHGVTDVQSGYGGGTIKNPSYKEVCTGKTGHAEVCQITFDPKIISYGELLKIFWSIHDPTTLNRQGNDIGTQYRSVIFFHNDIQKQIAIETKDRLEKEGIWKNPIVTVIEPFTNFYIAESYHDDYYKNNPNQPYCNFVITPKVDKFEKLFKDYIKEENK